MRSTADVTLYTDRIMQHTVFALAILLTLAPAARAEVTCVAIVRRADVGASGYEKLVGTIHSAPPGVLDLSNTANFGRITALRLARTIRARFSLR